MKRLFITSFVLWLVAFSVQAQQFPLLSYDDADAKAHETLSRMTLEEKIDYIGGTKFFYTQQIKRLGIPHVPFADATQGVRLNPRIITIDKKLPIEKTVAYPAPILLSSTWNKELAYNYARSVGEEASWAGIPVLLGPGFNMYRNAQCGRNFEYFGEDPYLVGSLIANYVKGLQSTGTIATLKHFVANETDYNRRRSNSVVSERALHEIYMEPFRQGIEAGAMAVMTSYNLMNGEWAGQSDFVINELLRHRLGFKWLVMTDWFSVWDCEKVVLSGQNLEMPYRRATNDVDKSIEANLLSIEDIDNMVLSILRTFYAMGTFESVKKKSYSEADFIRHENIALNTAREGIVLLENNGILPIKANSRILATGFFLSEHAYGTGAANVVGYNVLTLGEALKKEFGASINIKKKPDQAEIKAAEIILLSLGTIDGEAFDRPFELPAEQLDYLNYILTLNKNVVVILNTGSGVNMSKWNKEIAGLLMAWYWGQNGATAMAEILSGKTNPSGKLPITIERSFSESPAFGYLPEGKELYNKFKMRKELKEPVYDVHYNEDIFMGYRWYEHKKLDVSYPFGYGLSYTTFEYSNLKTSVDTFSTNDIISFSFTIKNKGKVDGKETVQLYISDLESEHPRPLKELKAYNKISLRAGDEQSLTFTLNLRDFKYWHPGLKDWIIEQGTFEIGIGASAADIRLKHKVEYTQ
jgi:beta-glucosidase